METLQMVRTHEEAEIIVQLDYAEGVANVCVAEWPAMYRRLCRQWGQPARVGRTSDGRRLHTAYWTVPLKAISFRKLKAIVKADGVPDEPEAVEVSS